MNKACGISTLKQKPSSFGGGFQASDPKIVIDPFILSANDPGRNERVGIVERQSDQVAAILPLEPDDRAGGQVLADLDQLVAERPEMSLNKPFFFLVSEPDAGIVAQFFCKWLMSGGKGRVIGTPVKSRGV